MKIVKEIEINYKDRKIYKKSPHEIMKLKSIKQNLTVPFSNTTIVHINADFEPTDIRNKNQKKK